MYCTVCTVQYILVYLKYIVNVNVNIVNDIALQANEIKELRLYRVPPQVARGAPASASAPHALTRAP